MEKQRVQIKPIRFWELGVVTRMTYQNMFGVDQKFTELIGHAFGRWMGYLLLPLYLYFTGKGYKALADGRVAGIAFLNFRQWSGYVFNVNVDAPYRRQGVASQLMAYMEKRVRARRIPWVALQVDKGNDAARRLYRQLGYREYHPHFWRRDEPSTILQPIPPRLEIAPAGSDRERLYNYYSWLEQEQGDEWAAKVVGREYSMNAPAAGAHWRCLQAGREVGYGWVGEAKEAALIILLLQPSLWGTPENVAFAQLLLNEWPAIAARSAPAKIELHLGSSAHYQAMAPLLEPLGFAQATQARILMLKRLAGPNILDG